MSDGTQDIVQRLWALCHVLRDDGITYHQYVTELVFLLFLKMAQETGQEDALPAKHRWADLVAREGVEQLKFYRALLLHLGNEGSPRVRVIYENATTALRKPQSLAKLVASIDGIDWFSSHREQLGELYEGLLQRNATEVKSGAGQYFTPRPLVDTMVALVRPQKREIVHDPAAGTAGFLTAADRYVKAHTNNLFDLPERDAEFQKRSAFVGMELVPETRRLAMMNLLLHGIESEVLLGDTLTNEGVAGLHRHGRPDVVLTNPPFGTKQGGGRPSRDDFTFSTSNKQLAFVEHIYRALAPRGRAAVVVPDNVLFEDNVGVEIRRDLLDKCDLHTILRLPTGIFYAQGVKTNVLFFSRGTTDRGNTARTWVYDLRTRMPSFGKRTPLTREHFADFERCYGDDPHGRSPREDTGPEGRWRAFSRDELSKRGDNLDLTWLKDDDTAATADDESPDVLTAQAIERLEGAVGELRALLVALEGP